MRKIDAHQHFWKYDPLRDTWIDQQMNVLKRDFLPEELLQILIANDVYGSVVVQSDQSETENLFQLKNADQFDFIKAVVGWVDLRSETLDKRLEYYRQFKKLKGFRHVLQGEKTRDLMLDPDFSKGLKKLGDHGFCYDILIFPDQLQYVEKMLKLCPNQKFVIDHIAKPEIKSGKIDDWKRHIASLAAYENVFCKISGLVTENKWDNWNIADFTPYLDVVLNTFGTDRVMYGSDWPVCELAATYGEVLKIVQEYFNQFSTIEQELFFEKNAITFYNINSA